MISHYAIYSIIKYRLKEFLGEYHYTIFSPIINNLLFVVIFSTIDNYYSLSLSYKNISFIEFLIPGLIIMTVVQESYEHSSNFLINMKQIGSFEDFLMAPISRFEIFISFLLSSLIIGLLLCIVNFLVLSLFVELKIFSTFFFIYFSSLAIIFFSCLGCSVGILAFSWDTQSTISNFFVVPINFLSGTFFSIQVLPDNFKFLFYYNPYYYIVDFFRSSFHDNFEFSLISNLYILIFVIFAFLITVFIFNKGFRIIK